MNIYVLRELEPFVKNFIHITYNLVQLCYGTLFYYNNVTL
jgi:hypothetical protein